MLSVGFLLWVSVEFVGVSGFMNILRPGGGCGPRPCSIPPRYPYVPQRPINCGHFQCGPQYPYIPRPPIHTPGGKPQVPYRPPMVPAGQHGAQYYGKHPGRTPTPTPTRCTKAGGICAKACNILHYTKDTPRYKCGIHGDRCCMRPSG